MTAKPTGEQVLAERIAEKEATTKEHRAMRDKLLRHAHSFLQTIITAALAGNVTCRKALIEYLRSK